MDQLKLNHSEWDQSTRDTEKFLLWVKKEVMMGNLVTIGVYTNEFLFYCNDKRKAGDPDYDHIVSVLGIDTSSPNDFSNFHNEDVLYFSDHGLWNPSPDSTGPRYIFNYTFVEVMGDRRAANEKGGRVYTVPNDVSVGNYGLSVLGVSDANGETVPVSVVPSQNFEEPEIRDGSNTRPSSFSLNLTVTVSELVPSVRYVLYRYDDLSKVPSESFNAHRSQSISERNITISSGTKFTFEERIQSSDRVIYRCVRGDGL